MLQQGLFFVLLITVPVRAAEAGGAPALEAGAYQIRANLELPNVEDMDVGKIDTLCLTAEGSHGFAVMSDNNPLRRCPISNVREDDGTLTFDIKCNGRNEAKASATYELMGATFRGRIKMQMGGKNMTMTEVQEGHRTGACKPTF